MTITRRYDLLARAAVGLAFASVSTACARPTDEPVELIEAALNGALSPQGFLIRKSFNQTSESSRQQNTDAYYNTVHVAAGTITDQLPTLASFRSLYQFGGANEKTAFYYNRGDLGIGREMHCVETAFDSNYRAACYVTNFAAGDDGSEFTFGENLSVAFKNLDNAHSFATVAMVFRRNQSTNKMLFTAFGADGNRVKAAPLDRHGILFNNAFNQTTPNNPDPKFGTPGVNFNNHIPTNCMSCHGGAYDPNTRLVTDAQFLPFDLDQFDYEGTTGRDRSSQEPAFAALNQIVRNVAVAAADTAGTSIQTQLDLWYGNTSHGSTLGTTFNSAAVPPGWSSSAGTNIYRSVVRRSCRTCHVATALGTLAFDTESGFQVLWSNDPANPGLGERDLCSFVMPHSLQALRQFWQSTGPADLEAYLRLAGKSADADKLHACSPGGIVTLDPPHIAAAVVL